MKRFLSLFVVICVLAFSGLAFAGAPQLVPDVPIPASAGAVIDVSTVGNKADYYILYTCKDAFGKITTFVYSVGGSRITDASELTIRLSHVILPMD